MVLRPNAFVTILIAHHAPRDQLVCDLANNLNPEPRIIASALVTPIWRSGSSVPVDTAALSP